MQAGSLRSQSIAEDTKESRGRDGSIGKAGDYSQQNKLSQGEQKQNITINFNKNKRINAASNTNYHHTRASSSIGNQRQEIKKAALNSSAITKRSQMNDSYLDSQRSEYTMKTDQKYKSPLTNQNQRVSIQKNIRIPNERSQNQLQSNQYNEQNNKTQITEESLLFDTSQINGKSLFQKSKSHAREVMYARALTKLRALLNNKGYQESALDSSSYGLFHFHIDALDNNIQLNRYETSPSTNNQMSIHSFDNNQFSQPSRLINLQDQSLADLEDDTIMLTAEKKPKLRRQETEEFISDELLKSSPAFRNILRKKTIRNDQFMMQLKPTTAVQEESNAGDFSARHQAIQKFQEPQRTILFLKEVDDNEKDYLHMEIKEFVKQSQEELQQAYNRLMKAIVPVFSGGIDTLINKIDLQKIQQNVVNPFEYLYRINPAIKEQAKFNNIEQVLVDQLKMCKSKLEKKEILYGQWSIQTAQGAIPDSREGATACMIGNYMYLFGGFSRDLFKDIRVFDIQTQRWRLIQPQRQIQHARFAHTMNQYGNKLYVFGGAGPYINSIKMRLSFNDIQIFDIDQEQWLKEPDIEGAPKKRQNHIAGILGSVLVVHGGFNTEQKKVLNDFGLFDIDFQKWVNLKIYHNNERIDDKHFAYDENQDHYLGFKQMHSSTVVVDNDYHQDCQNSQSRFKEKHMWLFKREFTREEIQDKKSFDEGIYIFGGCNQLGLITNDVWLIEPNHSENLKIINHHNYEYITKPTLSVNIRKIDDFKGKPPCPRILHSTTLFKDWNNHNIIVIYGGRNDGIFAKTQNVAMNDICLFNVNLREWQVLAIYGQMPCSRWSHVLTINGQSSSDGFFVFGGVNLKNYCKSRIYQFQIWNSWYKPKYEEAEEQNVDEKFEILNNNVKEKVDIIKDILNKQRR